MRCFPGVRLLLISRCTHILVVNTDALSSQNRLLFHFFHPSQFNCGRGRGRVQTKKKGEYRSGQKHVKDWATRENSKGQRWEKKREEGKDRREERRLVDKSWEKLEDRNIEVCCSSWNYRLWRHHDEWITIYTKSKKVMKRNALTRTKCF